MQKFKIHARFSNNLNTTKKNKVRNKHHANHCGNKKPKQFFHLINSILSSRNNCISTLLCIKSTMINNTLSTLIFQAAAEPPVLKKKSFVIFEVILGLEVSKNSMN